eukprot:GHVS01107146.1.p1 GENE.GHVS01107146.1~~GHVS01107146.1.p1  ORF type:complete len:598 (+),score=83.65 GHVS01107146.1:22-1794(+)
MAVGSRYLSFCGLRLSSVSTAFRLSGSAKTSPLAPPRCIPCSAEAVSRFLLSPPTSPAVFFTPRMCSTTPHQEARRLSHKLLFPPELDLPAAVEPAVETGCRSVSTTGEDAESSEDDRSYGLCIDSLPKNIIACQYAVRGEIVHRALEIEEELARCEGRYSFKATLAANIGNPQAVGQTPITFHRQVLSCLLCPELLVAGIFPSDVIQRAKTFLSFSVSPGAYTHSKGVPSYREYVANWLVRRDQFPVDPETVFLTDGASPGVRLVLELFVESTSDGVLIPIPQYPLYSATIARLGGTAINYYLQEASQWSVSMESLRHSFTQAVLGGITPRALVVINPGNPTGAVMTRQTLQELCLFCANHRLVLVADEVYQENVYRETPFISCRRVAYEMGLKNLIVMSFHSCSKGLLGECGLRGGMLQVDNVAKDVLDQIYKLSSISLCSNTIGQALMASSVNPPVAGEPSYERYAKETDTIYKSLKRKAEFVHSKLIQMEGVTCQTVEGAMYAFPRVALPLKFIQEAKRLGVQPDLLYCKEMLEHTGVVTVPGSGFGQEEGTWHYRITILPREDKLNEVMESVSKFHSEFMRRYKD